MAAEIAAMSYLHARPQHSWSQHCWSQHPWNHDLTDGHPVPNGGRMTLAQFSAPVRSSIDLPPCAPNGGLKNDWSSNACAAREGSV
jgi:hypothetical protein